MLSDLKRGWKRFRSRLPYLLRALELVWRVARGWTFIWAVLLVLQGLLPAFTLPVTKNLVDDLAVLISEGSSRETVVPVAIWALLMVLITLLTTIFQNISSWVQFNQSERVQEEMKKQIHAQSSSLDLAFYDSAKYYNDMHIANAQAGTRPLSVVENLGTIVQTSITLVAMGAILLSYGFWLPLALAISAVPSLFHAMRINRFQHAWYVAKSEDERRSGYLDWLLTDRQVALEVRLYNLGQRTSDQYTRLRRNLRDGRLDLMKQNIFGRLLVSIVGLVIVGVILIWMGWQTIQGYYSLGDLALFYQAFSRGQGLIRSLMERIGQIFAHSLFLENLYGYLALENDVADPLQAVDPPFPMKDGIAMENVTFRYPGSDSIVLENFSFHVPANQTVAVVGTNGSGKSTLLKLICRYYDPEEGMVLIDDVDLRDMAIKELRNNISVLFQEPVKYQDTVSTNIAQGSWERDPAAGDIKHAAEIAGADTAIDNLPAGYDAQLGTWFSGGTELSVGEWQKIALARSLLRRAPLVILDEPTSAMDPWAEQAWLERFQGQKEGQTVLIITHRFTTARYADTIYVMDRGRIIESGTHEELVRQNGQYASSWRVQMRQNGDNSS